METEQKEEPVTRRAALEAAFDELEKNDGPEDLVIEGEATEVVEGKTEADSEIQKEVKADEIEGVESVENKEAAPVDEKEGKEQVTDEEASARSGSAPLSWKAEAKAEWSKLSPTVRAEVARRETEVQRTLSYSAGARKFANDFQAIVQPYAHIMAARNSTPLAAVKAMMNTAAGLSVGTKEQKAAIVTEIITSYGVDLELLDSVLSEAVTKNKSGPQGDFSPQQLQALKPLFDASERERLRTEAEQQQIQGAAAETVESMAADTVKFPFFDALRNDIADVMEISAKRGKLLTPEQAYHKAVQLDDKYAKATQQRSAGTEVQKAARTLAAARNRASATRGAPSGGGKAAATPSTRREALEQAWDAAAQ